MNKTVIIVAGGSGSRMKSEIPKQFLLLNDKPILQHTIEKFYLYNSEIEIIVVLPQEHIEYWKSLCLQNNFEIKHKIVKGGQERFYSVKNAVDSIQKTDFVAIHDGVRPFVDLETIKICFETAFNLGNAIPAINSTNSVRIIDEKNTNSQIDRNKVKLIQTPQVFNFEILKNAYNQDYTKEFTDDASVVEKLGVKINLTDGKNTNIKITSPEDLIFGEIILKSSNKK